MMMGWGFLWIIILIVIVYFLFQQQQQRADTSPPPAPREDPLEVLQRRYAAGEITTEEYEERKRVLERDRYGL